jgi:hypothetical protein
VTDRRGGLRAGLLGAALGVVLVTACGGGAERPADLAEQDRFLRDYVRLLNASDEDGLARLLDAHPQGARDARARIAAYGGQDWDVRWRRSSDFADVWRVDMTGTARDGRAPVRVSETVTWEDERWGMAPLPGVVPTPPNAASTDRPQ